MVTFSLSKCIKPTEQFFIDQKASNDQTDNQHQKAFVFESDDEEDEHDP